MYSLPQHSKQRDTPLKRSSKSSGEVGRIMENLRGGSQPKLADTHTGAHVQYIPDKLTENEKKVVNLVTQYKCRTTKLF